MSYINKERILNESPIKRLLIGYDNLKENYTKENAEEYSHLYENLPLSTILEYSEYIFKEPFYGYEFYSDILTGDEDYAAFPKYEVELDKINRYIDENQDKMSSEQLNMYTNLREKIINKMNESKNTTVITKCIDEKIPRENVDTLTAVSDALYDYKRGLVNNDPQKCAQAKEILTKTIGNNDKETFFVYAPFAAKVTSDSSIIDDNINKFCNDHSDTQSIKESVLFTNDMENIVLLNKLYSDKCYREAVSSIPNKYSKVIFTELASCDIAPNIDEIITEKVDTLETYYTTPHNAVNDIFNDDFDRVIYQDEYDDYLKTNYGARLNIFEKMRDYITKEYQTCDDTNANIVGYSNFFNEGTTIEEAFKIINEKCEETERMVYLYTEKPIDPNEEVSDEDIDEMDKSINNDEPDETSNKSGVDVKSDSKSIETPKKLKAPKPTDTATGIQNKAMDMEVRQNKLRANIKQKGQTIMNAAKAVAQLPKNIIGDIKEQIKMVDDKDDVRREKYMREPGFRKKAFRNLKLALLYGGAARVNLGLIPVVGICRHYSKQKDVRIRNQLVTDIETNIKICEEKINDANAEGDKKEKYRLMRIRDQLTTERNRVRYNSKYI
jgi:hypothetical protein